MTTYKRGDKVRNKKTGKIDVVKIDFVKPVPGMKEYDYFRQCFLEPSTKTPTINQEADNLVNGDRNDDYGHPFEDFSKTAKMWEGILGIPVTPEHVGLCMIAVKMSRHLNKAKRDNLVDIAGYAATLEKIAEYRSEHGLPQ